MIGVLTVSRSQVQISVPHRQFALRDGCSEVYANPHLPVCGSQALRAPFGTSLRGLRRRSSADADEHAHKGPVRSFRCGLIAVSIKAVDPSLENILLVFHFCQTIKIATLTSHCLEDSQAVHVPTSRGC